MKYKLRTGHYEEGQGQADDLAPKCRDLVSEIEFSETTGSKLART